MKQTKDTNSVCPKCNTIFECGISAGKSSCWCYNHPSLLVHEYGEQCFCEKCLKELIVEQDTQKK
ncbi:MAG TPA: hypothetical protein DCQ28_05640 [Bacteroidetes bacterium]|nr:hypothetical protein [Bacteroidota bacterium]